MKIAFFEVKKWEQELLKRGLKGHTLKFSEEPLSAANSKNYKRFDAVSVFIYSKLDKEALSHLPKLKLITTRSTGYDHIDLHICKERNITVANVPSYGENTVTEHVFALILSLSRNVHKSYLRTLRNDFTIEGLKGFDLQGKTLGVVGTGKIGMHVVRIARGFGMRVLAYDLKHDEFLSDTLGFKYVPLDQVLKSSDIISLHLPYLPSTHHIINSQALKIMKRGCIIINTSRGGVIDTEALIKALQSGHIGGAGLDVVEGEELIKEEKQLLYDPKKAQDIANLVRDHILLSMDNVVFTPHIAFYSQEALERILDTTISNINAFSEKKPMNLVH